VVEKTFLDSGLIIISEYIPGFPSLALSYSLRSGSRIETLDTNGIHHLIEHMMFKGTKKFKQKTIADISDRLGGQLNAFTGKEITQYYIKTIDKKINEAFDLLTEIVFNSIFPEDEFIKEKNVVLQEIKESEDNPDVHTFETFFNRVFKANGLGAPIAGTRMVVSGFERDSVYNYYKKKYVPENLILAAVGNITHNKLVDLASEAFKQYPKKSPQDQRIKTPTFSFEHTVKTNRSLKQLYAIIGFEGVSSVSAERYQFSIMNDILGSGMSSRLFQTIREDRGLAYTISSFSDYYRDLGIHLIYSIVDRGKIRDYFQAVRDEISLLKEKGITADELDRSKDHILSSLILGLESNVTRMRFHVSNEMILKREKKIDQITREINSTTLSDVNGLLYKYLDLTKAAVLIYGNTDGRVLEEVVF
jgi:predicted Zn-dependent peptidase